MLRVGRCMLHVACCMLHPICLVSHVACCHRCNQFRTVRRSCAASIVAESAGLQLEQVAATGNAAEKALLADVTEKTPDASYVELLRLFKVRRSVADGHS